MEKKSALSEVANQESMLSASYWPLLIIINEDCKCNQEFGKQLLTTTTSSSVGKSRELFY